MKNHGHQFNIGNGNHLKISRIFDIFGNFRLNFRKKLLISRNNKRDFRADVLSLLSSALRPRLLSVQELEECNKIGLNRGGFRLNVAKIVVMTTILVGFGLFSLNFATPVSAASSLTLTIPNDILSLDLTLGDAVASKESDTKTVSVSTTAPFGYTLSIKSGDSSASALKNGSSLLASITTAMSFVDFQSKAPNNSWGFKPSMKDSNANSNYQPAPTSSGMTIEKTSAANSSAKDYNFSIATKIDPTAAVGVYKNTFTLTAVINTVSYNITYNLNSGTWSGTSPQTGSTAESSITLDSHAPTRSNYSFQGWCTVSPTNNSTTNPSCSGQTYTAGQSYTLANGSNTVNLYAMWKQTVTYRSYTINYRSNVGSPSNMPTTQTGSAASTNSYSVTLRSNTPTLSGYTFQGWCTSSTSSETCSGSSYSAGGSVTITSNNQTINLYAKWKSNYGASCQGGSGIILKDGKCWTTTAISYGWGVIGYSDAPKRCISPWRVPTLNDEYDLLKAYYSNVVQGNPGYTASTNIQANITAFTNDWDPSRKFRYWLFTDNNASNAYYAMDINDLSNIFTRTNTGVVMLKCVANS